MAPKKLVVRGEAFLRCRYEVELDMSEHQFEALSEKAIDELLDSKINWHDTLRNAEVSEFDIDEYEEVDA